MNQNRVLFRTLPDKRRKYVVEDNSVVEGLCSFRPHSPFLEISVHGACQIPPIV
jgi:hypothetical protein